MTHYTNLHTFNQHSSVCVKKCIKLIYSDGAPEFKKMCQGHRKGGVVQDITTPYRHTVNAKIERRNRMVLDGVRTALDASGVGLCFWPLGTRALGPIPTPTPGSSHLLVYFVGPFGDPGPWAQGP